LSLGSASGYDLKRRADGSIGHFWSESYGQIYPELKRLQEERLVTCEVARSRTPGKPARAEYSITAEGRKVLRDWLVIPPRAEPFRSELLLKLFFGGESTNEVSAAHVRRMRDLERKRLAHYGALEHQLKSRYARAAGLSWWLTTLSYGRYRSQSIVDWADETLKRLAANPPRPKRRAS
jgi:DNA-binding PadR family transcriptional regulator